MDLECVELDKTFPADITSMGPARIHSTAETMLSDLVPMDHKSASRSVNALVTGMLSIVPDQIRIPRE